MSPLFVVMVNSLDDSVKLNNITLLTPNAKNNIKSWFKTINVYIREITNVLCDHKYLSVSIWDEM